MYKSIPPSVKIGGKYVPVDESPRGSVTVGSTTVHMDSDLRRKIVSMGSEAHVMPWGIEMYKLFEQALAEERREFAKQRRDDSKKMLNRRHR